MAKAVLCPVCMGQGMISGRVCHGCGGLGWVEVKDEYIIYEVKKKKKMPWD